MSNWSDQDEMDRFLKRHKKQMAYLNIAVAKKMNQSSRTFPLDRCLPTTKKRKSETSHKERHRPSWIHWWILVIQKILILHKLQKIEEKGNTSKLSLRLVWTWQQNQSKKAVAIKLQGSLMNTDGKFSPKYSDRMQWHRKRTVDKVGFITGIKQY
jgi:hypothetical protein